MKAVCLLSGGLDSSTCLAMAQREGYECHALSFDYGQRHRVEVEAARRVAAALGAAGHVTVPIDLRVFGGSALTADIEVPKGRSTGEMAQGIPVTYVPARNTVFLSFALAWATRWSSPRMAAPPGSASIRSRRSRSTISFQAARCSPSAPRDAT